MKFKSGLVITAILTLGLQLLVAQTRSITGRVTASETGEALQGTQVFVKDTYMGTTTDQYGNYALEAPAEEVTLVVAFIGYKTQERTVGAEEETANFDLESDVLKSEQVVVTGLASSVKRRNLANAVATISAEDLVPAPAQTLEGALSGKFAGISVRQNTGAPGGGMSVNLRGLSTIEGSTQPLYVVDGVIVNNSANQGGMDLVTAAAGAGSARPQGQPTNRIGDINPEDIANIEVLKGASAAAMYGAKATNGVVIITTKRGTPGDIQFKVTQRFGTSSILKKIGHQKYETYAEALAVYGADLSAAGLTTAGKTAYDTFKADVGSDSLANMSDDALDSRFGSTWANRDIDYEDELYGESGALRETVISASGGTNRTNFYASGSVNDESGIVSGTGYKKYSGLFNLDHRFNEKATLSISTNLVRTESDRGITGNDNTNTTFGFSLAFTPSFLDIRKDSEGDYPDHSNNPSNPLHTRDVLINNEVVFRSIGSFLFRYDLLQSASQSLALITQGGADFYSQKNTIFSPPDLQYEKSSDQPGRSILTETGNINSNLYLSLAHRLSIGANTTLATSAGVQYETAHRNQASINASNMVVTQSNIDQSAKVEVYQTITKQQDRGFFVQEEVNLNDVIYLTAAMRGDRSSAIGNTDETYIFPKASASVRLSELGFWSILEPISDEFKIRVAYGQTGNLPIPTAKYTSLNPNNIGGVGGLLTGTRRGEPDIDPEITSETEFGFDATLLGGFASLEVSFFMQSITDLLLFADVPSSSGFTSEVINGGEMETKGFEASLNLNLIRSSSMRWNSRINYYKTETEITELAVDPFNMGGFATSLGTYRIEKGWSPTSIVGSEMDSDGNHIKLADETPDFQMSFNNSLSFGNLSVRFLFDWKKGGSIINLGKLLSDLGGTTEDFDEELTFTVRGGASTGADTTVTVAEAGPGRLANLGFYTESYIDDGTYLKLRELSVKYNVPSETVQRLFSGSVSSISVGVSGRNLWMSTNDFPSYDPEISQFGNIAIGSSVDTYAFPSSKSLFFEVSLGF